MTKPVSTLLSERYGAPLGAADLAPETEAALAPFLARGSCRAFASRPVPEALIAHIAAAALAAPSKSDLQQRDIVWLRDPVQSKALKTLVAAQGWTADIPELLVFCGNNRRQRQIHDLTGRAFVNDHLDAFFNAAVDAGVALATAVAAAEAVGLGTCPISTIRNHPREVSALLGLPPHVFPVAALALGWPAEAPRISPRLPLAATFHTDRFAEPDPADLVAEICARDIDRFDYRFDRPEAAAAPGA